ncbi:hypothetical protein [Micromonospora humidisoli]|uniref:Metallo-beta-lactamase superfamily protein n=1 Tax=Micromonospora humidisoli TaxID=2807622 RepID=A0ABS2JGD3_9ACTN|nr:hypothetical protein [Micromonospora humidisoli]MBM7085583.1 hypothetical protein [Micromonospora humidisoli]
MPWELEIHTIDIGVGEASLIIAEDPAVPGSRRSILIDGGLSAAAALTHQYVVATLPPGAGPDVLLVTHYDKDHSHGISSLLFADNLSVLCDVVVGATVGALVGGGAALTQQEAAAKAACATVGILYGSWGVNVNSIDATVNALTAANVSLLNPVQAAERGVARAEAVGAGWGGHVTLITSKAWRKDAGLAAGAAVAALLAMANPPTVAQVRAAVAAAVFPALARTVPNDGRFDTGGIYRNTRVVDIGDARTAPAAYAKAVAGELVSSTSVHLQVPGVNRQRTGFAPTLGDELFWNGVAPPVAPANAPYAVLVSGPLPHSGATASVWQGVGVAPQIIHAGQLDNRMSIGLVVQFNDFRYFTAGDLPLESEDQLAMALMVAGQPLPNGAGGLLPALAAPPWVTAFKASHHGADTSTSDNFLNFLGPKTAIISCGREYGHPFQAMIDRLEDPNATIEFYFLTNCRYPRVGIRASPAADRGPARVPGPAYEQNVPHNWSRISGDNNDNNGALGRDRGNIVLRINQAGSTAMVGNRTYTTTYWEHYPTAMAVAGPTVVTTQW